MGVGEPVTDPLKIYVRLPVKIEEELQIKELHPKIESVQLPRQKSRRWCFIKFEDENSLIEVVKYLRTLRIEGKKIVVKNFKQRISERAKLQLLTRPKQKTAEPIIDLFKVEKQ